MVGHQTVGEHPASKSALPLRKVGQIKDVVVISRKEGFSIVTTMKNMVRVVGYYDPGRSGHLTNLLKKHDLSR
jgi:hypothetical protein